MKFLSIFDVLGPNMIGPSSSHTAGAVSIGLMARKLLAEPVKSVKFILYGSFARTYRGHGTDKALLGGILGFDTNDERIRDAFGYAKEEKVTYSYVPDTESEAEYPNMTDIELEGVSGKRMTVRGVSVGGGKIKITGINGIQVEFTGEYSTLIVKQNDRPGVAAHITQCLSEQDVNIAFMRLFREEKGETAYTIVESDEKIPPSVLQSIRENEWVHEVLLIQI